MGVSAEDMVIKSSNKRRGATKRLVATAAVLCALCASSGYARTSAEEAQIKVNYIYNFMKFTEWPPALDIKEYIVCVLGSNPFGQAIQSLTKKTIREEGIRVVTEVPLEQTKYCHVAFVSRSETARLGAVLAHLRQLPVLTVSDIDGFSDMGGAIELIDDGENDVLFRVNQQSTEEVGLHVSSKLLSMSR